MIPDGRDPAAFVAFEISFLLRMLLSKVHGQYGVFCVFGL